MPMPMASSTRVTAEAAACIADLEKQVKSAAEISAASIYA